MTLLTFWSVTSQLADCLVVLDAQGTVYYLSLGKWNNLVDGVKKDFRLVKRRVLVPGKEEHITAEIKSARANVKCLLDNPANSKSLRSSMKYEFIFGTKWQRQVWTYLVDNVPAGQTITYGVLANRLSRPQAARAVGGACAANRIAILVPCHRVFATSHKLTGYRWGLSVKKELLASEKSAN